MKTLKQIFISFVVLLVIIVLLVPRQVSAIPVIDIAAIAQMILQIAIQAKEYIALDGLWFKEYVLDPLAYQLKDVILQKMVGDINNWAASGFQGSPVFLEHPEQFSQDIQDITTGAFLGELGTQLAGNPDFFCSGMTNLFVLDVGGYGRKSGLNKFRCTLDRATQNVERFQNNFANGGWQMLYKMQEGSNNPGRFYMNALLESEYRREAAQKTFEQGAQATGGYVPNVTCSRRTGGNNPGGDPTKQGFCSQWTIHTPAKAIGDRVAAMTGADLNSFFSADELSEIISSFIKSAIRGAVVNLSGR